MVHRALIALLLIRLAVAWPASLRAQEAAKSPPVAGTLSFLVPFGTGSFYAGNMGHGVRHLAIGAGALLAAGIANHRLSRNDAEVGSALVFMGAGATFLINWIWGTAAAVDDARTFNRRHTLLPESKMSLHVAPATDGAA